MTEDPNRVKWRIHLSRILFDLRWKLFGGGQSDYRCLTCRMPVDDEIVDDRPQLILRQVLRSRRR
ncbi:MAG: hypothetical protein JWO98_5449 [Frankiales bacterium]|nr:hypothetical protein [Frankiales bacterium]